MIELNNREIAILAWAAAFLGWAICKAGVRQAFGGLVRALLVRQILLILALMMIYIMMCASFLATIDIWRWSNLKTTVLWTVTFAIVTMFDINRITEDDTFFRKTIRDTVSAAIIVVFIAEFYTFSLPAEFIFIPFVTLITALYVMSQYRPEFAAVEKLMSWVLSLVGLGLISYGIYKISENFREFATFDTGRDFAIPIILSLLFLPFIYVLSIYVTYEKIFTQLNFTFNDQRFRRYAKVQAILSFRADLDLLRRWARSAGLSGPNDKENVRRSIREIKKIKEREKHPPIIQPSEGWSPYVAKEFLREEGLVTGDYHSSFDGWFASSPYLDLGDGIIPDNIAYYVEGDELTTTRLKLTLNVNNPDNPQASEQRFLEIVRTLLLVAVSEELRSTLGDQISLTVGVNITIHDKTIQITREDWPHGIKGGYSLKFNIEHRAE